MERTRKGTINTIAFALATIALVGVIAFSIVGTVISQSNIGGRRIAERDKGIFDRAWL